MDAATEFARVTHTYPRTPWWGYVLWTLAMGSVIVWSMVEDRSWAFGAGILIGFFGTEYWNHRLRENGRKFAGSAS